MIRDGRHEVAGKLRQMANAHHATEASRVTRALGLEYKVYGTVVAFDSSDLQNLADLIDPTCTVKLKHVVVDDYRRSTLILPVCPACGFTVDKRMPKPNFCPVCGVRLGG